VTSLEDSPNLNDVEREFRRLLRRPNVFVLFPTKTSKNAAEIFNVDNPQKDDILNVEKPQKAEIFNVDNLQKADVFNVSKPQKDDALNTDSLQKADILNVDKPQKSNVLNVDKHQKSDVLNTDKHQKADALNIDNLQKVDSLQNTDTPQKSYVLIVLDGTWREAKKMYFRSPALQKLPAIHLDLRSVDCKVLL
jgi:hypothetical protein